MNRNRLSIAFVYAALMATTLLANYPATADEVLESGTKYVLHPWDFQCFTSKSKSPEVDIAIPDPRAECDNTSTEAAADVLVQTSRVVPVYRAVDLRANAGFDYRFQVSKVPEIAEPSRVPIHIAVPVKWDARLLNNAFANFIGSAALNMRLRLIDRGDNNRVVEDVVFFGASHGGIGGCLSIVSGAVSAANTIAKCALALADTYRGGATVTMSALVETGRTYSVRLVAQAAASKKITPGQQNLTQVAGSRRVQLQGDPTLRWEEMTVEIGTDPALHVADLQQQIDELKDLQQQIDDLNDRLETHTHIYRTGRGEGHNNTRAETTVPLQEAEQQSAY